MIQVSNAVILQALIFNFPILTPGAREKKIYLIFL